MGDGRNTLQAVVLLFFGLAFSYFAYDLFALINNAIPKATYPVGNALMWTAYIIFTLLITLVGPLLLALQSGENTNLKGFVYGYLCYIAGAFITMVSWGFMQILIGLLEGMFSSTFLGQFLYFASIIIYTTLLIFLPLFVSFHPEYAEDIVKELSIGN